MIVLVVILVNFPSHSVAHDLSESGVCGDPPMLTRDLEREFKGRHESEAAIFAIEGLTLNKSRLSDVEAKFGPSTPASTFSDHDGISKCYKSPKWPDDPTIVTFIAGAAGGYKDLTGFELKSDSSAAAENCVTSSLIRDDLRTASGLRLGLSQPDAQRILGLGRPGADGIKRWFYTGEVPNTVAEAKRSGYTYYLKYSGVIARFRDSKADCISVFRVESY